MVSDPQREFQLSAVELLKQPLDADPDDRRFAHTPSFSGSGKGFAEILAEVHSHWNAPAFSALSRPRFLARAS
jgi:hypothetical protein